MQVFRHKSEIKKDKNTVVTIGTFDGIHLGHQQIIKKVRELAESKNSRSFFVTFDPHPRQVITGKNDIRLLTMLSEKISLLENYGIENLFIIEFTKEFSRLTSGEFINEYIIGTTGVSDAVIGFDHHFGKDRSGDIKTLEQLGVHNNFDVIVVDPFTVNGEVVSSTKIRRALEAGDVKKASELLGRFYSLEGKVVEGDKRGRGLGFPTANLELPHQSKLLPALGIYAVEVELDGETKAGLLSIGNRPTFYNSGKVVPEVYIYDFDRDIYGRNLKINLVERIRNEEKYSSAEELISRMNKDREEGTRILSYLIN